MSYIIDTTNINQNSQLLAMIGNNIANANTNGFKGSEFNNVLAAQMTSASTNQIAGNQDFAQGTISTTSNPLDMAINGKGFLQVKTTSGTLAYTRNGGFTINNTGAIVNSNGDQLTGYTVDANGSILSGNVVPLTISAASIAPKATANATLNLTLNTTDPVVAAPFNSADPTTYEASTTTSVYDATGTPVNVQTYYVKTSATTYNVYASVGGTMLPTNSGQLGTLTFNTSGILTSSTTAGATPVATASLGVFTVPVGTGNVNFNMGSAVQYGTPFSATSTQDGNAPGQLVSYQVANSGIITANYSNGQTANVGQVVLASFSSTAGLSLNSSNEWVATNASGQAQINTAGAGGTGTIQGSATENSNVNVTNEMVNLISAQRSYQAAAEVIKIQSEDLTTAVQLGG